MTRYICTLTTEQQAAIMTALLLAGSEGNDLELAMNGRICDLEDTINIEFRTENIKSIQEIYRDQNP